MTLICYLPRFLDNLFFLYIRWSGGPRVNEVEPILVMFEDKKDKEQVGKGQE